MILIPSRVALRAATRSTEVAGGCRISTYSVGSHGYAQIGWCDDNGRTQGTTAHRAAWVHYTGRQIAEGMTIDHLCKTRKCVVRDHLRELSNYENARRTSGQDWPLGRCIRGHDNSELYATAGRIRCYPCTKAAWTRYNQKRRASA